MQISDQLPRVFQANVDRFYQRVIVTALCGLPVHARLETGVASGLDQFFDRCQAQVDNHTVNETAKAFALTLDGIFQRQLSRWSYAATGAAARQFDDLLRDCAKLASIDLIAVGVADNLGELHLVANVVRHGEGPACTKLKVAAPQLWDATALDYFDLAPPPVPASEELRIRSDDLKRYARAIFRFWGHADPLPMATREVWY